MTLGVNDSGSSGTLLRIQFALVNRFAAFVGGEAGVRAAFTRYGLESPDPLPDPVLYDEPRAGAPSYFRIGDASTTTEILSDKQIWAIDQEIEAHVDPVRGRAAALAMGDLVDRAFCPRTPQLDPPDHPHSGAGLYLEPWLTVQSLTLPTDPMDMTLGRRLAPIRVTDMIPTDSRIGYSEAGLTYQVISTWNIVAESLSVPL